MQEICEDRLYQLVQCSFLGEVFKRQSLLRQSEKWLKGLMLAASLARHADRPLIYYNQ